MNNENIEILDKLNDRLCEQNKECIYQFIYWGSPNGFVFSLEEIAITGQSFIVFDSNEPLPKLIERQYENGLSFKEMVILTIRYNIQLHIKTLEVAGKLLEGM